jgi:deoxyhypusine synthase
MPCSTWLSARDLARAADIYDRMLRDQECGVILCLAGSLISAGLKKVFVDLIRNNMVDAIVSTGANIVDQDFFEALGFKHYIADELYKSGTQRRRAPRADDRPHLRHAHRRGRAPHLRRDHQKIADSLPPRPYSSREFIREMGAYLEQNGKTPEKGGVDSIVSRRTRRTCRSSARRSATARPGSASWPTSTRGGEAESLHRQREGFLRADPAQDRQPTTGLLMIGGGVPKNFAQDIVVAAEILGNEAPMHKYAIQITVADVRDGALSGSTLKEASSWGKVDTGFEQMVYSEATLALPLIAGYAEKSGDRHGQAPDGIYRGILQSGRPTVKRRERICPARSDYAVARGASAWAASNWARA